MTVRCIHSPFQKRRLPRRSPCQWVSPDSSRDKSTLSSLLTSPSLSLPNEPSGQPHSGVLINQDLNKKQGEKPSVDASQLFSSSKFLCNDKSNTTSLKYI